MPPAKLVQPLQNHARECLAERQPPFVLAVHDWSQLPLRDHQGKSDRFGLHSATWNLGYELLTTLLVSAETGRAIAPVALALEVANGVHTTYGTRIQPGLSHLDALRPMMHATEQAVGVPCVHVIDREGNAVFYLRQWSKQNRLFVVRSDYSRLVQHEGEERNLRDMARLLARRGMLCLVREVSYHGCRATQEVAETTVVLTRAAYQQRPKHGSQPHVRLRGEPLTLRLVVSCVYDEQHRLLAEWYLLTNVPATIDAATVALWYYWRWPRRESTCAKAARSWWTWTWRNSSTASTTTS